MKINFTQPINKHLVRNKDYAKVGLIYSTKNYQDFVLNSINRSINEARVNHFVKEV